MQRVQAALKDQLTRQNEKLELDLKEKVNHVHVHVHGSFFLCMCRRCIQLFSLYPFPFLPHPKHTHPLPLLHFLSPFLPPVHSPLSHEQQETLKTAQEERETLGVKLYGIQQQLAKQQMLLEKEQDELSTHRTLREQREATLGSVRKMYQQMQDQLRTERQQCKRNHTIESQHTEWDCTVEYRVKGSL